MLGSVSGCTLSEFNGVACLPAPDLSGLVAAESSRLRIVSLVFRAFPIFILPSYLRSLAGLSDNLAEETLSSVAVPCVGIFAESNLSIGTKWQLPLLHLGEFLY